MLRPLQPDDPREVGPYRLRNRLGRGGMGQVYLGVSPGGRLVAVKVVRPELADDANFRRRFAREVTAARAVAGFYTAPVVDADPDADPPWLVTAYISGPTLHEAVQQQGPLPPSAIGALGAGLAEGLGAIHAGGVVHRDLKPGNVILAEDGPRMIDFGIARAMDETHTVDILGTPPFMSPEQATGAQVGAPGDVFSLGALLVFAATGQSPFGAGQPQAILYRVVHEEPDLSGLSELPDGLTELIAACLAKDPEARPEVPALLDSLAALKGDTQWLPPGIISMITENRTATIAATKVDPRADQPPAPPPTPPPAKLSWLPALAWTLGACALGVLIVLAAIDSSSGSGGSTPTTTAESDTSTSDYYDTETSSSEDETTTEETTTEETTTTDEETLDDESTDQTPFTLDAFMPDDFTDDSGRHHQYEAGSTRPCTEWASEEVASVLTDNGCSEMLVANFVDDDSEILTTVWVYPFADYDTADTAYNALDAQDFMQLGCWDPNSGPGSGVCDNDVTAADEWQYIGQDHRYVIVAQSKWIDLRSDGSGDEQLKSAASEARSAVGPDNYYGN
ncbi:serine/threonine-protein kinase [Saccharopolyspora sp. WRP15-2]|uniref:Serine/threonine-protein kinase n=1 Tax=Saccharopolyspora oryzae TaxID=2997343 RepID=A0ABT4UZ95_9PSEU|nr:serine/threonine-protein kinase [Saccharopolyspora oryzae]MDA3627045.1 serine/threonine-protein kinase [Saccharopolyspora oryzae]